MGQHKIQVIKQDEKLYLSIDSLMEVYESFSTQVQSSESKKLVQVLIDNLKAYQDNHLGPPPTAEEVSPGQA